MDVCWKKGLNMLYLSLDIETTGLDPLTCDVLEIGAILEDTENPAERENLPTFHEYLWRDVYRGEPYALAMNGHIFQKILALRKQWLDGVECKEISTPEGVLASFGLFLDRIDMRNTRLVLAGKNVAGFDIPFLNTLPSWKECFKFHHRVIDPGMMYFNPHTDKVPPDLKECKKRADLPEQVSHEALDDAWDVIQLVRKKYPLI